MQPTAPPSHSPGSQPPRAGARLPVLFLGLATTALALTGVWLANGASDDFQIMSWYLNYVIPIGAILVGVAASSGYGLGSLWTGARISGGFMLAIVALQAGAYFAAQYLEFASLGLVYEDGTRVGFLEYFHWASTSFAWVQDDGTMGAALGSWGYGLRALEVIGFSAASLAAPALLRSKPYCDGCARYMKKRRTVWLAASVPAKRIKKSDAMAREVHASAQQEALEGALGRVEALCEHAAGGEAGSFKAVLDDPSVDVKGVHGLPVRASIELSSCAGCGGGVMRTRMVSGQGQNQKTEMIGQLELRPHFASEVSA